MVYYTKTSQLLCIANELASFVLWHKFLLKNIFEKIDDKNRSFKSNTWQLGFCLCVVLIIMTLCSLNKLKKYIDKTAIVTEICQGGNNHCGLKLFLSDVTS